MVRLYTPAPTPETVRIDWLAGWRRSKLEHPSDFALALKYTLASPLILFIILLLGFGFGLMMFAHFTKDMWPEHLKPKDEVLK